MTAPVFIQHGHAVSALGMDAERMRHHLFATHDPDTLRATDAYSPGRVLALGCLPQDAVLPSIDFAPAWQRSRNNAMAWAALLPLRAYVQAAVERYGPQRVALIVGTSTAGLDEGEAAARQLRASGSFPLGFDYGVQELGDVAAFASAALGIQGPAHTISTACSSGAKALASAARLLRSGMVDAVVAGGVDALSRFTVAGFGALEAVSAERCNPLSEHRKGINLGEGAAFFLLGREAGPVRLAGWGETQDAHHMSAPDPTGRGARMAMQQALDRAGMRADQVDYVNLHGTATAHNDAMECLAVHALLGGHTPVSSTKPLTGHTLAAAGALEAAVAWHVLQDNSEGRLPAHRWDGAMDPALAAVNPVAPGQALGRPVRTVLSNSFAFGGSNCTLLLESAA